MLDDVSLADTVEHMHADNHLGRGYRYVEVNRALRRMTTTIDAVFAWINKFRRIVIHDERQAEL